MQNMARSIVWVFVVALALPAGVLAQAPAEPGSDTEAPPPASPATTAAPAEPAPAPEAAPAAAPAPAPAPEAAPTAAPAPAAPAADPPPDAKTPPKLEVSGYVEAGYHLNLSDMRESDPVALRSYDGFGGNTFLLHAAHLALGYTFNDSFKVFMSFDAGSDAILNEPNGAIIQPIGIALDVQEAYATYTAPFGLSVIAGKFATYEGIEVIGGPSNPTITRGFLYGLVEPFTTTGVKLDLPIGKMVDIGGGVINGWDLPIDNNKAKTGIFRIGFTPMDAFSMALSGSYGAERPDSNKDRRLSLDLTGAVVPTDWLTVNFQANVGEEPNVPNGTGGSADGSWYGFGLQPVLTFGGFLVGARFEYLIDHNGTRTGTVGTSNNVWNLTVSPGYKINGWMARVEFRVDKANHDLFTGKSAMRDNQETIAAAISYEFD